MGTLSRVWLTKVSSQDCTALNKSRDPQPSGCFVPVTFVVVGRGSSSTTTSGTSSGSGTGAGVTGAEEVTSITGSADCGGSRASVVCGSRGFRFLANASAMVGCEEAAIWKSYESPVANRVEVRRCYLPLAL